MANETAAIVAGGTGTPAAPARWPGWEVASKALGALAALVGLLTIADTLRAIAVTSDTVGLVTVVDWALAHIARGEWLHWSGYYALLQAIPVFFLRGAGVSAANVYDSLVALNVLSFAFAAWITWRGLQGTSRAAAIAGLAVLLSGPLLWYLHTTTGEPLAAACTLAAAAACWNGRRHAAAAAALFVAGLSKDTAVPFLLLLCLGASIGGERWTDAAWRRRRVAWLLAAGAASLLVTAAYNYARFGSVLNVPYLGPLLYVPWLSTQISFFAAIWLSPNGGLLPFWPTLAALLLLAAVAAVRSVRAYPDLAARLRRAAPGAGVGGLLLGMTLELSKWVAPLGWSAWGPRLLLPWLPAVAYVLLAAYGTELERLFAWLLRPRWRFWAASAVLAVGSMPQYVVLVRPTLWLEVFVQDAACPAVPLIENGAVYYYHCTNHQLWTKGSMLLSAFRPGADPGSVLIGAACAGALVWLLSRLRMASLAGAGGRLAGRKAADAEVRVRGAADELHAAGRDRGSTGAAAR